MAMDCPSGPCGSTMAGTLLLGADLQKLRLELIAGGDVHRLDLVRKLRLLQQDGDLPAIGCGPVIKINHALLNPMTEFFIFDIGLGGGHCCMHAAVNMIGRHVGRVNLKRPAAVIDEIVTDAGRYDHHVSRAYL